MLLNLNAKLWSSCIYGRVILPTEIFWRGVTFLLSVITLKWFKSILRQVPLHLPLLVWEDFLLVSLISNFQGELFSQTGFKRKEASREIVCLENVTFVIFLFIVGLFPLYRIINWWKITTEPKPHYLPFLPSNRTCPCHIWSTASFINWVNYHGPVQIRSGYKDYTPSIVLCRDINRVK